MIDISYKRCKTDVYAVTGICFVLGWGGRGMIAENWLKCYPSVEKRPPPAFRLLFSLLAYLPSSFLPGGNTVFQFLIIDESNRASLYLESLGETSLSRWQSSLEPRWSLFSPRFLNGLLLQRKYIKKSKTVVRSETHENVLPGHG